VLCTADATYDLRQVSTSNTVFITQPINVSNDDDGPPTLELRAIAQPQTTLEVLPTKIRSATSHLSATLPAYTSTGHYSTSEAISKAQCFASLPFSEAECERSWTELACFELSDGQHAVVPSAQVIILVWEVLLETATARGVDLTAPVNAHALSDAGVDDNGWPQELSRAVLQSVAAEASKANELQLDPQICAKSVGRSTLKILSDEQRGPVSVSLFKSRWADLLPEAWRHLANLTLLEGSYQLEPDASHLRYYERSGTDASANGTTSTEAKSTLGAKRKWHEKFRASKKVS